MIRFIAYVGPKDIKRTQNDSKSWHEFPQGVTIDADALGFSQERIKFLLKSNVFQVRTIAGEKRAPVKVAESKKSNESPVVSPRLEPPRLICGCGFVAKSAFGLQSHQRWCRKNAR
jgi:hypothetical protein